MTTPPLAPPLVDAAWLRTALGRTGLVVLDVRSPADGPTIPEAVHADYAKAGWRATVNGMPGFLPEVPVLEALIGGLGIGNPDHVVVVSSGANAADMGNATRVYWTFKALGHDAVSVLDGGMAAWTADPSNPVGLEPATLPPKLFKASPRPELRATLAEVEKAVAAGTVPLVDSRSAEQFAGKAKSPTARAAGTLPGAVHIDNASFYSAADKRFVTPETVRTLASQAGATQDAPIAFCNTGHLASVAWFAMSELAGIPGVRLYDGSMTEWTADPSRPLKNGEGA
ncbi:rhodanese-like domain-containing protein [Azospirillum sp. SYSU D00513]|uniref:sulfurtransferase n=1 Tax=Azospirillum sp. SYSU D00513 TaxID=2812561 RepID=UPI001A965D6F|nr:rhodanese-like domain-containing protein [Azospirillum sp. SYSU D00513]